MLSTKYSIHSPQPLRHPTQWIMLTTQWAQWQRQKCQNCWLHNDENFVKLFSTKYEWLIAQYCVSDVHYASTAVTLAHPTGVISRIMLINATLCLVTVGWKLYFFAFYKKNRGKNNVTISSEMRICNFSSYSKTRALHLHYFSYSMTFSFLGSFHGGTGAIFICLMFMIVAFLDTAFWPCFFFRSLI